MSSVGKEKISSSDAPTYSDILDKIRKETVLKDEAGVEDISRLPDTPDDDIRCAIDSNGCNALLGDSSPSHSIHHRNYIPSPLNSPATARRLTQKLGNQISAKARGSPKLLTKAACKIQKISPKPSSSCSNGLENGSKNASKLERTLSYQKETNSNNQELNHKRLSHDSIEILEKPRPQHLSSLSHTKRLPIDSVISPTFNRTHSLQEQPSSPTTFIQPKAYNTNRPHSSNAPHEKVSFFNSMMSSSWLPSFMGGGNSGNSSSNSFPALSSKQKMSFLKKNCFANNCPDYNIDMEMHRFGDTGRISNRYQEDRWDVWTTMGEDVNNYEEIIFDDDEDDEYEENEDEYEVEDPQDNHCHHSLRNDDDVIVSHNLDCGARLVHCCEKHHHVCQGGAFVEPKISGYNPPNSIENNPTLSRQQKNGHNSNHCNESSDKVIVDNGRSSRKYQSNSQKQCIASSNSSSSDEFLELPFNDLSVSSGIYGAARNASYVNSNLERR